jgi:hypothetical protein
MWSLSERTSTDRYEVVHRRYGAGISKPGKGRSDGGDQRLR